MRTLFTSESVTEGHPDKICDQISDAVLDAILEKDPMARVACECAATTGMILVMGEITTSAYVSIDKIARQKVIDIGYDRAKYGFDGNSCAVLVSVDEQSSDIAMGVDNALEGRAENQFDTGAGDQGMMFGYACDETTEYMPLAIALAHRLTRRLAQVRKSGELPYLRPDGKAQVTVEYQDGRPLRVHTVVVSAQHAPDVDYPQLQQDIIQHVVRQAIPGKWLDGQTRYLINPTGRFVIGGPQGDSGLTGRKIIVDTYGGYGHHGGGAFSGKDPTKVDRSGAYAARHVAMNLVAAGMASRCEVGLAYAIGVAQPVSLTVNSFGTGVLDDEKLAKLVGEVFDLRPAAIIERLDLRRPIYAQVAAYGHFGRPDLNLPWERLDHVEALRQKAGR
ncbi:MAG TPA: methionine adenosyltransferase [Candidatus Excrementavichristensenella intestinipullorum]|nr:methionine adenosyltransferase [Candidatus Excrementavichristensenella intestinipullorum]